MLIGVPKEEGAQLSLGGRERFQRAQLVAQRSQVGAMSRCGVVFQVPRQVPRCTHCGRCESQPVSPGAGRWALGDGHLGNPADSA